MGEQPLEKTARAQPDEPTSRGPLGIALAPLTPDTREKLEVPEGLDGAVIRSVRPGSPAAQAGLRPGDVIVGVGGQKVGSPSDVTRAIGEALSGPARGKDHAVALRVLRDGSVAFVGVTAGEPG